MKSGLSLRGRPSSGDALAGASDAQACPCGGAQRTLPRRVSGIVYVLAAVLVFALSGCVTAPQHIDVTLSGTFTETQQTDILNGLNRWDAIVGERYDTSAGIAGTCVNGVPNMSGTVDDVAVDIRKGPIDGPGGVVEHGTLCQSRADGTTVWGVIKYDEADMAAMTNGALFDDMTTHAMGHVLGFGTSLKFRSLVSGMTFTGPSACTVWTAAVCPTMTATRDHWSWTGDTMSSGITDFGAVSAVTEAAMRDAGYAP